MFEDKPYRPRRSVLYVPASNAKALAKVASLNCDVVIVDLEDSVGPDEKQSARQRLQEFFAARGEGGPEIVIRINALSSGWGTDDLAVVRTCRPDAVLLPKVDTPRDIHDLDEMLDAEDADLRIWAMIETPRAILNLGPIAELGRDRAARLDCLVAGTNDLAKEIGLAATNDRRFLAHYLAHVVVAARAGGLDALDGPFNDFSSATVFEDQCRQAMQMGFDGKTLIHPSQIDAANKMFAPAKDEVAQAQEIIAAFALSENAGRGVISIDGRMVERLHLKQAERLIAKANAIQERDQ